MKEFQNLGVIELSQQEMCDINGGDKFMRDFGYGLGRLGRGIWDFVTSGSSAANETLMNCI